MEILLIIKPTLYDITCSDDELEYNRFYFDRFMAAIKGAITRPAPIPMRIDATNIKPDVLRNMKPTPTPISVVPPMIQ